jgi:hypothetical protein
MTASGTPIRLSGLSVGAEGLVQVRSGGTSLIRDSEFDTTTGSTGELGAEPEVTNR